MQVYTRYYYFKKSSKYLCLFYLYLYSRDLKNYIYIAYSQPCNCGYKGYYIVYLNVAIKEATPSRLSS
jgi:hypothetical protein